MTINLDNLNVENCELLDSLCQKKQSSYANLIKNIFDIYKSDHKNADLNILHPVFSKDDRVKGLFYRLCKLSLVKILYKKNVKSFFTSDKVLAKIIKKKYQDVSIKLNKKNKIKIFSKTLNFAKNFFYIINLFFAKNTKRKDEIIKRNEEIIIIETFYSKNLFKNNQFNEQYHHSIINKNKKSNLKKLIYFYPIILINAPLKKYIEIAKKKLEKQIFCFDFLHFKDYFVALFFSSFFDKEKIRNIFFDHYQVDDLIKSFINENRQNRSTIIAILNYYFFKRLKEQDIKIKLIIDWYENQIIDKGFNLGKNKFYEKVKCKGHMGFVTDFGTSARLKPSIFEQKQKLLPDEILVCGPKIKKIICQNNNSLKVKVVPALRNQHLYELNKVILKKRKKKKELLVIFSADNDETFKILDILNKIKNDKDLYQYSIKVRLHRQTPKSKIQDKIKDFIIDDKEFMSSLLIADLVIVTGSTAAIEAYIIGKNVIIIGNTDGVTKNPLRDKTSKNAYRVCYNEFQLLNKIKYFENLKFRSTIKQKNRQKILKEFFTKMNKKKMDNFFN